MKRSRTLLSNCRLLVTTLAGIALTACASAVFGQVTLPIAQVQNAGPTIFLSGPRGDRSTLTYSARSGWRLHAGWRAEDRSNDDPTPLEPLLTVFLDGPTGNTFIYVLEEGWRFVGRVADRDL
jgi:hypothetical protein